MTGSGAPRRAAAGFLRRLLAAALPILAAAALVAACDGEDAPPSTASRQAPIVPLDSGTVRIETASDTFVLRVEIAETPDQTQIGLMARDSMPADEGMIFLFTEPRDATAGFWMFRTRIPLDIAYLDAGGRIVAVRGMEPCASPDPALCEHYPPGVSYTAALEVNRGYLASRGIGPGARVTLRGPGRRWPSTS
jgi:uncharacterized protein